MNFWTQLNSEKPGNQWRGLRLFLDSAMTKSEVKLRSFSMYPVSPKKPRSVGGVLWCCLNTQLFKLRYYGCLLSFNEIRLCEMKLGLRL